MTLTPAYGRDYKSQQAVLDDFYDGLDFIINDITSRWDGKPANLHDLDAFRTITFRYDHLRKVFNHDIRR